MSAKIQGKLKGKIQAGFLDINLEMDLEATDEDVLWVMGALMNSLVVVAPEVATSAVKALPEPKAEVQPEKTRFGLLDVD